MVVTNEFVTSVKKENNLGFYTLHTIWKDDGFRINITSKDASWSGEMTPDNVKELSEHLQLDKQEYIQNCKDALTTINEKPDMKYSIENGSFVWKKLVDEDSGISVKLGSVRVVPTNFAETIQGIVGVNLTTIKNLQEINDSLNDKIKQLESKNNELHSALESATISKINLEEELYAKFLEVLNSKKKMILKLQNELENKGNIKGDDEIMETKVTRTRKQAKPASKPTKAPPKATARITRSSKKASDIEAYEMDTDNDSDNEAAENNQRPSTRLREKNSLNVSDGASCSQKSVVPESSTVANECPVDYKAKNDENDSDSTISDESLANYSKANTIDIIDDQPSVQKSKTDEKIRDDKPSPQKSKSCGYSLSQLGKEDLLEHFFG